MNSEEAVDLRTGMVIEEERGLQEATLSRFVSRLSMRGQIVESLKSCYDPEIPFNIVDLGLVYYLKVTQEEGKVEIKMTLTAPGCPVGPWLIDQVKGACLQVEGVKEVGVEIVFDPTWNPQMMSDEAHKKLGL